ncbi:MAG: NUDIX hydrolase [Microlunatus sp.]|nr:NUDIX hydrolase [Microlunatus sp.]MDN5769633.1 NUDIX hydrolase [Microlunatus sp.]
MTGLPKSPRRDPRHPGPLHRDAVATLTDWLDRADVGQDQRSLAQAYLAYLSARPDAMWRSCEPGHLTASVLVLNEDRSATLLTLHPRVGRWLQLGGHCEPGDPTLVAAALREATEESGIDGLRIDPLPVRLDVHALTCSLGKPTRHLDVQFRAVAPAGATARISSESDDLAWHPVADLPAATDLSVRELVAAALR